MKYKDLKLTERKAIAAPSYLDGVDLFTLNREMHTYTSRVAMTVWSIGHGFPNSRILA